MSFRPFFLLWSFDFDQSGTCNDYTVSIHPSAAKEPVEGLLDITSVLDLKLHHVPFDFDRDAKSRLQEIHSRLDMTFDIFQVNS